MHPTSSGQIFNLPLNIWGVSLDITSAIIIMWAVALVIFAFLFLANRFKKIHLIEEFLFDFINSEMASSLKTKNKLWFSFLITLFLFVLFNNLSGMIPGAISPTSNINVTGSLAILVFLISQILGLAKHGFKHFKYLMPENLPWPIFILMVPIEIISQLSRPFSLAIRLFANMFAGHMILTIFLTFVLMSAPFLKPVPFSGVIVLSLFEIFIAFIQAFIFAFLASYYISDSLKGAH